jgi:hypothetical protein
MDPGTPIKAWSPVTGRFPKPPDEFPHAPPVEIPFTPEIVPVPPAEIPASPREVPGPEPPEVPEPREDPSPERA